MPDETTSFFYVLLVAALAPIFAALLGARVRDLIVPIVVLETVLGALIGPDVLGIARVGDNVAFFGELGLGFLFFFAGYEIDFSAIRGEALRLAIIGWVVSLGLAYGLAYALAAAGVVLSGLLVGSAMSTTALGTLIPVLRDAEMLHTRLGTYVMGVGAVGEFGPVIIVTVLLSATEDALSETLLLLAFLIVAVMAALVSTRAVTRARGLLERTMETSAQLPVRLTTLLLFALSLLASKLGLDIILGAFAAGSIVRLLLPEGVIVEQFESKLDAVGFGLLIPFFFVTAGMKLDLDAMTSSTRASIGVPVFVLLFLIVRGVPVLWLYRDKLPRRQLRSLALLGSTQLPLVVAITSIGVDQHKMRASTAAALVAAAVISVLIFPALALRLIGRDPQPGA